MRVKALKLELGKDLKFQASGIWTQLCDQNRDTCNHQLSTPRMKRITKVQIANCKHHQIKRFLQNHVLSQSLLWEAHFNFIQSLLWDRLLRKTHPACVHGGDNTVLLKIPFCPTQVYSTWTKFLSEETEENGPLWAWRGVLCPPFPIHVVTLNWLERRKPASPPPAPHVTCNLIKQQR